MKKTKQENKTLNIWVYIIAGLLIISIALNVWLVYKSEATFPPENYNPWIHDDPKMMCLLLNNLDNANLREPACNAQSEICKWTGSKCVGK